MMQHKMFHSSGYQRTWCIRLAVCALALGGCHHEAVPIQVHQWQGQQLGQVYLDAFLRNHSLAEGQSYRVDLIGESESASYHIVQIRDRENPHLHKEHEVTALLLRGGGRLYVGTTVLQVGTGAVVSIPRNVAHYFVNDDPEEPAVIYAIFTPALKRPDVVEVQRTDARFGGWRQQFASPAAATAEIAAAQSDNPTATFQ